MLTVKLDRLPLDGSCLVLDLGCGAGRHSHGISLLTPSTVIAFDIDPNNVVDTQQSLAPLATADQIMRCNGVAGSGTALPFADNTLDVVICSEVLEHVHDYQAVLSEIVRVLKPGGDLVISVPRFWPEWICWRLCSEYANTPGGHIRIFRTKTLLTECLKHPLTLQARHWAHALHTPYWWLKCAFWAHGDEFGPVKTYHRFLVWDLIQKPKLTRVLETLLNPLMGKSIALYFKKMINPPKDPL